MKYIGKENTNAPGIYLIKNGEFLGSGFPIEEARAFFQHGLDYCDERAEQ